MWIVKFYKNLEFDVSALIYHLFYRTCTILEYSRVYFALPMQVEEMYAPEINDFVYITDNAYSALEIRQMELRSFNFFYIFRSFKESDCQ
jgi:hypothetical protein